MTRTLNILVLISAALAVVGCAPQAGVVVGVSGPEIGSSAPDIYYVSAKGEKGDFNKARYRVAVIAFSAPEGANCCWLDPRVMNVAGQLSNLPVTVAQFSLPKGPCTHDQACQEILNLHNNAIMSLCDAQHIAWNAYGKPAPGSLLLIGPDKKIRLTGTLDNPNAIIAEARRLGLAERARRNVEWNQEWLN